MLDPSATLPDFIEEAASSFEKLEESIGWVAQPASTAAAEQEYNVTYAAEWGDEPVSQVYAYAVGMIQSSTDHLKGMARTVAREALLYSPATLARSSAEASARASWILDPALSVRQRLARGFTEVLYSGYEQRKLMKAAGKVPSPARYEETLRSAEALGFNFLTPDKKAPAIDQHRLSATNLFAQLDDDPVLGEFTYRALSAGTHATLFSTLGQFAAWITGGLEASVMMTAMRWLESYAALRFLGKAVTQHLQLAGGRTSEADALREQVKAVCEARMAALWIGPAPEH